MSAAAWLLLLLLSSGASAAEPARHRLVLQTAFGDIVIALFPDAAPRHVEQVLRLAALGAYDTTSVYRVASGRYVQFTAAKQRRVPLTRAQAAELKPLPLEAGLKHERGAVSMARYPDKADSAESSFSIVLGPNPRLDGHYTVFGKVEDGWETLSAIAAIEADRGGYPAHRVELTRALVLPLERLADRPPGKPWRPADPWSEMMIRLLLAAVVALGVAGRALPGPGSGRSAAALAALFASVALAASSRSAQVWVQVLSLASVAGTAWAMRGLDAATPSAPATPAPTLEKGVPPPPAPAPLPAAPKNPFWPGNL